MNAIKAYFRLNLKVLLNDKISFIWSIIFPIGFILSGLYSLDEPIQMAGYYAYIIFYAYVIQLALECLYVKNSGYLKVYFSIKETKLEFFMSHLLSQVIFSFISILAVNLVTTVLYRLNFVQMMKYGVVMIITGIPVAFLFFAITLIKGISYKTLATIMNIALAFFALVAPKTFESPINFINPLVYMCCVVWINNVKGVLIYSAVAAICVAIGLFCISRYSAKSNEVR